MSNAEKTDTTLKGLLGFCVATMRTDAMTGLTDSTFSFRFGRKYLLVLRHSAGGVSKFAKMDILTGDIFKAGCRGRKGHRIANVQDYL